MFCAEMFKAFVIIMNADSQTRRHMTEKITCSDFLSTTTVFCLQLLKNGSLLIGAGNGTVALVKGNSDKYGLEKSPRIVRGAVTSVALRGQGHQFFVGTDKSQIYRWSKFFS